MQRRGDVPGKKNPEKVNKSSELIRKIEKNKSATDICDVKIFTGNISETV